VTVDAERRDGLAAVPVRLRPEPGRAYRVDLALTVRSVATLDTLVGRVPAAVDGAPGTPGATKLPTVSVRETATDARYRGPAEFEQRQKMGVGRFLTRVDFQKREAMRLPEIIQSQVGGFQLVRATKSSAVWIAGGRGQVGRTDLSPIDVAQGAPKYLCYTAVMLNGILVYGGRSNEALFDVSSIPVNTIKAAEFYRASSETPAELAGRASNACGLIVLWTL
jgi:hypothetical protein